MDYTTAMDFSHLSGQKMEEEFGTLRITIEPGSYCLFDYRSPSNGLHYHYVYEICLVVAGSGEFKHGKEIFSLGEGDVFIANPEIIHEIRLARNDKGEYCGELHLVFFTFSIFPSSNDTSNRYEEIALRQFLDCHAIVSRSQHHLFSYLGFIRNYNSDSFQPDFGLTKASINFCLECIFSLVNKGESLPIQPAHHNRVVEKAISYILSNIHQRIFISDIAEYVGFSERNLQLLFKNQLKKTMSEYISERKASLAAGYLKMNFKVNEVSNILGICDVAQFSRMFKRHYGVSPKKYQQYG